MRQKRAKAYRKLMSLYSLSFGFRQPYQLLVDSDMCRLAVAAKIDLQQQLSTVLQGTIKPMITQCCIHELYLQGKSQQAAVDLAKSLERRKCNHKEAIPGEECIATVVGGSNKHRYVIATQSQSLRVGLRLVPAVPIVHINRSVMVLEPPSDATLEAKHEIEENASRPTDAELAAIKTDAPVKPRKRRGPKGPNPLSVKKKAALHARKPVSSSHQYLDPVPGQKRKAISDDAVGQEIQKRKRRRRHSSSDHVPQFSSSQS